MNKNCKVLIEGLDTETLESIIYLGVKKGIEKALSECRFGTEFKDEILSRKQVAEMMGKSPDKITSMFENNELPGHKSGKEYLFLKSQIVNLFKFQK
jgi:excisionase family DNA binding protein